MELEMEMERVPITLDRLTQWTAFVKFISNKEDTFKNNPSLETSEHESCCLCV